MVVCIRQSLYSSSSCKAISGRERTVLNSVARSVSLAVSDRQKAGDLGRLIKQTLDTLAPMSRVLSTLGHHGMARVISDAVSSVSGMNPWQHSAKLSRPKIPGFIGSNKDFLASVADLSSPRR